MNVKPPLSFTYGNIAFGADLRDAWACFRVGTHTFDGLPIERQRGLFEMHRSNLAGLGADFQIARMASAWDADAWARAALGYADPALAHLTARRVEETREHLLGRIGHASSHVFVAVRLADPVQDIGTHLSKVFERPIREWLAATKRALSVRDRRMFRGEALEDLRHRSDLIQAHLTDYLPDVRPALPAELQWWVRRQFTRGLGEPLVDGLHEPQALIVEINGEGVLQPLEADVLRWMDSEVRRSMRGLEIDSELGTSRQAMLVLGALPEYAWFPSPRLQLMFTPVEELPFAADLSLNCRYIPNALAIKMTRTRIQDADEAVRSESEGDQGASDRALDRRDSVRELLAYLQGGDRPPLLMGSISIALGAETADELEAQIEQARRLWGPEVKLHRPLGDQLQVFFQHFPGQPARALGYDAALTVDQVAAMMPTATHSVGPRRGFLRGFTLSGSRQPVLANLNEGSERNSPTGVVITGAPGRGKTQLAQDIMSEAFERGFRIVDIEAKGDHQFHNLAEVRDHAETIDVTRPSYAGLVDPLLIAPPALRDELARSWLTQLLPTNAPAEWQTAIHMAVAAAVKVHDKPMCGHVVNALLQGDDDARKVGEALVVYAQHGLTRPGFGDSARPPPAVGDKRVTYIPIRNLPGSSTDTPRNERTRDEAIGDALLQLLTAFAVHLFSRDPGVPKLLSADEAHRLLSHSIGRRLIATSQRMGRSEQWIPVLSTQLVPDLMTDEEESGGLIGEFYVFGVKSQPEARRALRIVGRDPSNALQVQQLLSFAEEGAEGRCIYRAHDGTSEAIKVWIRPSLLTRLDTNPTRREEAARARAAAA